MSGQGLIHTLCRIHFFQMLLPISKQEFQILKTVSKSLRGFIFLILDQILPMILSAKHFNLILSLKQAQAFLPNFEK